MVKAQLSQISIGYCRSRICYPNKKKWTVSLHLYNFDRTSTNQPNFWTVSLLPNPELVSKKQQQNVIELKSQLELIYMMISSCFFSTILTSSFNALYQSLARLIQWVDQLQLHEDQVLNEEEALSIINNVKDTTQVFGQIWYVMCLALIVSVLNSETVCFTGCTKLHLFLFTPCLPHLFHHVHLDQTEESPCRSLGSRPMLVQGHIGLLFETAFHYLSIHPPQLLLLVVDISKLILLTWPYPGRHWHPTACWCYGIASSTLLSKTDLAVAPLPLATRGILVL